MRYFSVFIFTCLTVAFALTSCQQLNTEVPPTSLVLASPTFQPKLVSSTTSTVPPVPSLTITRTSTPSEISIRQRSALISGSIDKEEKKGKLEMIYILDRPSDASYSGPYSIRLEDKAGKELGNYSFDTLPMEGILPFTLEIPWDDSVFRIVLLKDGNILAERSASVNPPVVHVLSPNGGETISEKKEPVRWEASDADGDKLTYVVQFSDDGGKTWLPIGINLTETSIDLDTSFLKNTQAGVVRVLASDGFYTSQDVSDEVFTVKTQAGMSLHVDIDEDGGEFAGEQSVILEGEAYSNRGSLPEDEVEYTWSSNIDGVLGQGSSLFINAHELSEGKHLITLTAEYDGFQPGSDSIEITIYREFSSLSVEVNELNFNAKLGDPGVMDQAVEIWHLGTHSITWSATAGQKWIVLKAMGSETPSNLIISVDLSDLPVGVYTGNIIIESNAEGTSTHTITVKLEIK
jgi:hypothetical protein